MKYAAGGWRGRERSVRTARDRQRVEAVGEAEVRVRDELHVREQREERRQVRVAHALRRPLLGRARVRVHDLQQQTHTHTHTLSFSLSTRTDCRLNASITIHKHMYE